MKLLLVCKGAYLEEGMHSLKVLVGVTREDDDELHMLQAILPSKTEAWCRDLLQLELILV